MRNRESIDASLKWKKELMEENIDLLTYSIVEFNTFEGLQDRAECMRITHKSHLRRMRERIAQEDTKGEERGSHTHHPVAT